ncbi:MAG: tRNA (adenosine(37)-N6)-threonylcarbamoyltransferase complex dimerization subunit type 1 TsaB [Clostridiales bacterium]|nr:tRNA (adenosine(37)-N6)-threonylcarbamoyltransferase complex dimerization subunit type 1 TsaB [Clostridiales bacterium]
MRILAVESSGMVAAAAIMEKGRLLGEFLLDHKKTHSQQLMPLIAQLLNSLDMTLSEIDVFAVSQGPGSFTGLRIGIATVKGLAQAAGKQVVGIPTLDGLAYNLSCREGLICPIMDARRDQVYTAVYRSDGSDIERLEDYMAIPVKELAEKLKGYDEHVIFNGDGIPVYWDVIKAELGDKARPAPANLLMQHASSVARLALVEAQQGKTQSYNELIPFYLRKSQAEQKFAHMG